VPNTPNPLSAPGRLSRGQRRTDRVKAQVKEAKRLYTKEKLSIRQVAAHLGVSYSTAHKRLEDGGVKFRGRGGNHLTNR
jgi:transposase